MDILYLLIPLSLAFVAVIAWVFLWAVKSGQFEDMEGPAHRILLDDEKIPSSQGSGETNRTNSSIDIGQAEN
ncbi:MAG: cbb3-type cytochrome oxidase assembly protein CcoS [Betaproteobacteria bacterium]|nr:cbb3-type cytochrome oxidase assembly protein CcoS [Betaproteobacteria bacterium]